MQVTTQPYELLVRWLPDGSLSGAHHICNMVVTADDGTVTIVPGEPKPLDTASSAFTTLIGTALSASQAQVTALTAQVSELQAQVASLTAQIPPVEPNAS